MFTLAAKLQPCVIFIDEVDALLGKRNSNREHEALRCEGWQACEARAGCGGCKAGWLWVAGPVGGQSGGQPRMPAWLCIESLILCPKQGRLCVGHSHKP